ncbi:MAG: FAD:protein FMN transferase, partial [Candidatus Omnitrophica bacterium]|nr:FAD:protein FMN transferase [Candidatus Omnitrophota bacterium]
MNIRRSIFFILIVAIFLFSCQNRSLYREERILLGTLVEVISPCKDAPKIVFEEIERIEELLSKYKENSEVSQLNRIGRLKVSKDTFYIIEKAKWFWENTEGAFDITVGPLLDLWGLKSKNFKEPREEEIKDTLKYTGSDKIVLKPQEFIVEFIISGLKIDLGGIAKGYAVDCAVRKLRERNIKSCLINAGGD